MGFIYRYDLTYHDIGISSSSFVARLITGGQKAILPDDLTDEQGKHLGSWLKGLYDSGNEGLSNDVFASSSPKEFYIIVPTLFQQTVLALSTGILSFESVKGGVECESFFVSFNLPANILRSDGDFFATIFDWRTTLDVIVCAHTDPQRPRCFATHLS
jgi:hypothetical protein